MRIGIDARSIFSPRPRGTGRNLRDAYRLIPSLRPEWQFIFYHQRPAIGCPLADGLGSEGATGDNDSARNVRARQIDMRGDRYDLWLHWRLPRAARRDRLDLLHFPANAVPRRCSTPYVVTIHDLVPLLVPGEAAPEVRRKFRANIARAVRQAAHVITVSEATRRELLRAFDVRAERVTVIPWAPDARVARPGDPAADVAQVRPKYGLPASWLLNFSGAAARKNSDRLLAAWALVPPALRRARRLVLVGCAPDDFRARLAVQAHALGVEEDCALLDFVPHEDLRGLLHGAAGLVMPSLCEGFGLPIVDAFATGTPVLTSSVSSMPEVAENAALFCDPTDPHDIARGIRRLLDPAVAAELRTRGAERVQEFTWERTAEAMCRVFGRCAADARAGARRPRPFRTGRAAPAGVQH